MMYGGFHGFPIHGGIPKSSSVNGILALDSLMTPVAKVVKHGRSVGRHTHTKWVSLWYLKVENIHSRWTILPYFAIFCHILPYFDLFWPILTYFDLFWPVLTPLRIWLSPSLHQPLPLVSVKSWGTSPVTGPRSMLADVLHFGWLVISLSCCVIFIFCFLIIPPFLLLQCFLGHVKSTILLIKSDFFLIKSILFARVQSIFLLVNICFGWFNSIFSGRNHIFDAPSLAFSIHMFVG